MDTAHPSPIGLSFFILDAIGAKPPWQDVEQVAGFILGLMNNWGYDMVRGASELDNVALVTRTPVFTGDGILTLSISEVDRDQEGEREWMIEIEVSAPEAMGPLDLFYLDVARTILGNLIQDTPDVDEVFDLYIDRESESVCDDISASSG